jgi:uncharacterized metal-binding protein YceD (DUF177 family)
MPQSFADHQPEFSRTIEVDRLDPEGLELEIEADAAERDALARRFSLIDLERLSARLTIEPVTRRLYRVRGRFRAAVVQSCVVTLEPVASTLEEDVSELFGTAGPGLAALLHGSEADEVPEPIEAGRIDVGEVVAQHLVLALDPYPRKADAVLPVDHVAPEGQGESRENRPFAVLKVLKKDPDG